MPENCRNPATFPPQVLTSTSTVAFQTFACDDRCVEGESYLRADYSLSCNSKNRMLYMTYAGVMIMVGGQLDQEPSPGGSSSPLPGGIFS